MFKNTGNTNLFQRNKKMLLGLIGVSFLTGAAVIDKDVSGQETAGRHRVNAAFTDKDVPGREIADRHRVRPDVPLHPVIPKDKLPLIEPKDEPMALLYDGWVSVGSISGYDVKYRKFAIGSDYIYQILGTSEANQLGFACFCANVNTAKTWKGAVNSSCDVANPNAPVKLDNAIMGIYKIYNVNIPDGSCCKSAPRVGLTAIPGLPPCS
ncbi:hypothetical protein [Methylobacter sp. BlB1]|jgi:hypothetical protein|uniref:hypothetical protein n=1 Tax=Methylobacter sp. BlB1 TaxID=2785914 RepID=UPI0018950D44|nr:hypothetical protein [Methylobacter sp. BlB1]MBF6648063.1 hypothetical protein [Methylobacter sp. BlB1]